MQSVTNSNGVLSDTSANKIDAIWNRTTGHLFLVGDADQNGVIDTLDVGRDEKIIVNLNAATPESEANGDGLVDARDVNKIEISMVS